TPAIVLAPLFGLIADLHGRRLMLILGLTLFALAGGAAAFAPSFGWLLVCRALQGVAMSMLTPLTIVLISDLLSDQQEIHRPGFHGRVRRGGPNPLPVPRRPARGRPLPGGDPAVFPDPASAPGAFALDAGDRRARQRNNPALSPQAQPRAARAAPDLGVC